MATVKPLISNAAINTNEISSNVSTTLKLLLNLTTPIITTPNGTSGGDGSSGVYSSEITVTKYIIIVVCFISAIVGMSGNLIIVIVRIFKQVQRGNTTAYAFLICQLAIADFIFAFTICFDIHTYLHNDLWGLSKTSCKFIKLLQSTSLTTTVGFLTIMAFERYCGISNPLKHRWSIKKTSLIVLALWVYIFLTFIPFVMALGVKDGYCGEYYHSSEEFRKAYTMFLFVTNYMCPLISIIYFHTLIVNRMKKHLVEMRNQRHRGNASLKSPQHELQRNRNMSTTSTTSMPGEEVGCHEGEKCCVVIHRLLREKFQDITNRNNSNNNNDSQTTKPSSNRRSNVFRKLINRSKTNEDRKLVHMLVAVTLSFALMTLPTQIYYIWYDFGKDEHSKIDKKMLMIVEVFSSLVYLHCCSNCIIYSAMDKKFRADVAKTFRFIFNIKKKPKINRMSRFPTTTSHVSRFSRHTSSTTTSSSKKSDDVLIKKHLEVISDEEKGFSFQNGYQRETVIL